MAILALICSMICVIPGLGLIAIILGISAAIGISNSRGRVGGLGLAITGIVLGLIFSMAWVGIGVISLKVSKGFETALIAPLNQGMTALEAGDYAGVRGILTPEANAAISDERLREFRDSYQGELGAYKSMPQGIVDYVTAFSQIAPLMQQHQAGQPRQNTMPSPASFDKGAALVMFVMDQNSMRPQKTPSGTTFGGFIRDIEIWTPSGTHLQLMPAPAPAIPAPKPVETQKSGEAPPAAPEAPKTPPEEKKSGG